MDTIPPLAMTWDGEALVPKQPRIADKHLVIGQTYLMVEHQERSSASHRHYFALVNEAYANLPEGTADAWLSPEHLRKWALIRAGYCDERSIVCASKAEAARVAAFIRPMNACAVVEVRDAVIRVREARSQSHKAMSRKEFQESKDKVLAVLAELIGVSPDTLAKEAGRDAA